MSFFMPFTWSASVCRVQLDEGFIHGKELLCLNGSSAMAFSVPSFPSIAPSLIPLLLAAPLLFLLWRRSRGGTRQRYHAIAGTILHQIVNFRWLYDYQTEISIRHKSFRILISPFHSRIYTNDPTIIEHILSTKFENYGKGPINHDILGGLLGDGIFTVDGAKWRHQRKIASYEFSTRSLRDSSSIVFKKKCVEFSRAIAEIAESGQEIDLQGWLVRSMMDTIFEVSFGVELNSLHNTEAETGEFVRALDESSEIIISRYFNPMWKLMRFFNLGSEAALKKNLTIVDDFVLELIQSKIDQVPDETVEKADILSRFLRERQRDPSNLSYRYLRDIILSFIIAGKDTTAGTLAWFFYLLSKNPAIEKRMVDEIYEAVGTHDCSSFEEVAARLNEEALMKMTYLHAALSETLRLQPVVPITGKICFGDDTLPDGYEVKAGEFILYQPYSMGRMKYLWGEDAEIFRPERWLDSDGNFSPQSPFKFTAFQAGPRICLGREFAYRQMKIFAAVLLYFFSFELRGEEKVHYRDLVKTLSRGADLEELWRRS